MKYYKFIEGEVNPDLSSPQKQKRKEFTNYSINVTKDSINSFNNKTSNNLLFDCKLEASANIFGLISTYNAVCNMNDMKLQQNNNFFDLKTVIGSSVSKFDKSKKHAKFPYKIKLYIKDEIKNKQIQITIFGKQEDFTIMFVKCKHNMSSKITDLNEEECIEEYSFTMQKNQVNILSSFVKFREDLDKFINQLDENAEQLLPILMLKNAFDDLNNDYLELLQKFIVELINDDANISVSEEGQQSIIQQINDVLDYITNESFYKIFPSYWIENILDSKFKLDVHLSLKLLFDLIISVQKIFKIKIDVVQVQLSHVENLLVDFYDHLIALKEQLLKFKDPEFECNGNDITKLFDDTLIKYFNMKPELIASFIDTHQNLFTNKNINIEQIKEMYIIPQERYDNESNSNRKNDAINDNTISGKNSDFLKRFSASNEELSEILCTNDTDNIYNNKVCICDNVICELNDCIKKELKQINNGLNEIKDDNKTNLNNLVSNIKNKKELLHNTIKSEVEANKGFKHDGMKCTPCKCILN